MTGTTEAMKSRMRIRLSTMLLLVVMLTLMVRLYVLKRSESKMQAMLAGFRDTVAEGVVDLLDRPLALPYADGASLEQFLRTVKASSTLQPKLPAGIPIYVDPIGLSEADKTMTSTIKKPAGDQKLTLREHLKQALKPLGLDIMVRDRFLMITSEESVDARPGDDDPYRGFRDVLR
jgi:hypothetical protein